MTPLRRVAGALIGLAVTGSLLTMVPASSSAAPAAPAASVACVEKPRPRQVPRWRMYHDTKRLTAADYAAVRPRKAPMRVWFPVAKPLPDTVWVPVRAHVIRGKHRGERGPSRAQVRALIATLNSGFSGTQSPTSVPTRFRFVLKSVNYKKNDRWYHAYGTGPRDRQAKRKMHRGGRRTLNLYLNGGGTRAFPILGWSRLPWQQRSRPRLDSVSVNVAALPGGSATNYNQGKTVIHETGHWLGLFHPFQGGCTEPNDLVADTPQESGPSFFCDEGADSCPADPGHDAVHNFMDYSYDSCLTTFSPGQVARMDAAWADWRA